MKFQINKIDGPYSKAELAEVVIKPENESTVSITFQTEEGWKAWLERFAFAAGQRRSQKAGGMVGNVSWSINIAILFLISNFDYFLQWYDGFMQEAIEKAEKGE